MITRLRAEGQTTITARSVDVNGNIEASKSDVIKIDKTPPTFTLGCPGAVLLDSDAHYTVSGAADDRSGLAADPDVFSQDGDGQYHYNLDTKCLSVGTWSVKITLDDGTSTSTRISLR